MSKKINPAYSDPCANKYYLRHFTRQNNKNMKNEQKDAVFTKIAQREPTDSAMIEGEPVTRTERAKQIIWHPPSPTKILMMTVMV